MQPPKTSEELAEMYPDLEPWQRDELEVWHRGWITKMMLGEAHQKNIMLLHLLIQILIILRMTNKV